MSRMVMLGGLLLVADAVVGGSCDLGLPHSVYARSFSRDIVCIV